MPEDQVKINKQSSEFEGSVCCHDGDHYPYGTSLRFEANLIEELGIESLAVGDIVEVRGYAFVDSKSEYSNMSHSDKNIGIQMTSLKVVRDESDHAEQLYGPDK